LTYTALYRKFRPLKFEEMVGEEHITSTLKKQIVVGRVGHAYLFNGGRGTGKTSAAKILARAVNCLNPKDGEPCNECENCKAMLAGTLADVVEMDAASNNSVEDIRAIREEVNFLPTVAKYRVYIIDEVHMLSTGAFNSLLKTLEEPPEHVKFILATTEPQKLPATILSRCQRFDFKRISNDNIIKRLRIICKETNIKIEDKALELIAILSEGALRDAISILERCIGEGKEEILEQDIRELVGIPTFEYINEVTKNLIEKNSEGIIKIAEEVINQGKDIDNFIWEIIKYIKDILLFKATGTLEIYADKEKEHIKELAEKIEKNDLLNLIYDLSELASNLKNSSQKAILFETGLIKATLKKQETTQTVFAPQSNETPKKTSRIEIEQKKEVKPKLENNVSNIKANGGKYWDNILNTLKSTGKVMLYTNLIGTTAKEINDMIVEINFNGKISPFAKTVLEQRENKDVLEKLISQELGKVMHIKYNENIGSTVKKNDNSMDIPINIIDE